jgi:membrane protease subunit HflC
MVKNIFAILSVVGVLVIFSSMYVLNEAEQAIVIQFGKPVGGLVDKAGLHFKVPVIQNVIKFDKRILEWDGAANEIPTIDNKYIFIDAFARWKILDALQFYKSAKNEMLAQSRLDDIIDGAVRDEISTRTMEEIIRSTNREMQIYETEENNMESDKKHILEGSRTEIVETILQNVRTKLSELNMGIEVVDVQLKRIDYNKQVQNKLFNRMISEQNMIAEKYRAQGQGKKQEILGMQIQKEKEITSSAYLKSQEIRGKADAEAVQIYADAYGKSPEFYNFQQTLDSYKRTLDSTTQLILSTDNKYLKYLE